MNRVDNPTVVLRFTVLTLGWRAQRVASNRTRTAATSANWPARQYLNHIKTAARRLFVTHSDRTQLSGVTQ